MPHARRQRSQAQAFAYRKDPLGNSVGADIRANLLDINAKIATVRQRHENEFS
jgi:hypothetical protein